MELTVDGRRAFAYTGGHAIDSERPSLLFVHGAGADHTVWALQSRYFAYHDWNVLAPDLPGHGRSAGAPLAAIGDIADWLIRLLEAAGIARAILVGHSMGSLAALETAARHPTRSAGIALLGTSVPMPVAKPLMDAARANDHMAFDMIAIWGHSAAAQIGGNRAPGLWMTGGVLRLLEKSAPGVLHADLKACDDYREGLESAAKVTCPALLLLGDRDLMTPPRASKELAGVLADVRTVMLDGCGHEMMAEQPDQVLDALIEFARAHSPP